LLHNTQYDFNDEILPLGAALFARLAERSMPLEAGHQEASDQRTPSIPGERKR
jgi:hippurate hydrolase